MPAMTEERQEQPAAVLRRPQSGLNIDPERLTWYRESRGWSRQDLSDQITALELTDENGDELTVTRDAIAKIENPDEERRRKPKARTVRALCAALSTEDDPVTPRDLLPGGEPLEPHTEAVVRRWRLAYNKRLRAFANRHGITYRNPDTGRVYYSRPLRDAFTLADCGAAQDQVLAAVAIARAAQREAADARDPELLAS